MNGIDKIKSDPRIERFIKDYDGRGRHMIECKDGYRFEGERTIDIGTIAELLESIKCNLDEYPTK